MPALLTITKPERPIDVAIGLPRSKSVANRMLVLAALAGDMGCVKDVGDADDTRLLRNLLRDRPRVMHCGLGGTTFRFLLAWAAVREGKEHVLTGDARLLARPHQPLIDALRTLGADIEPVDRGFLVRGKKLTGGSLVMDAPMSSQFISALLLIAPLMETGLHLHWTGTRFSEPYVKMTLFALAHFDVLPRVDADGIRVRPRPLRAREFRVPPDWSAAAFWFEVAAIAGNLKAGARILLTDLHRDGWQGDQAACELWQPWVRAQETARGMLLSSAAVHNGDPLGFKLRHNPDLFQPLALTCAALGQAASFNGLENLPLKETDRIAAVGEVLDHLDRASIWMDGVFSMPAAQVIGSLPHRVFEVFGDHRMAMSLAPLALSCGSITLRDPAVVSKSYPHFWDDLKKAGFGVRG